MTSDDNLRMMRQQVLTARSERMAATLGGVQPAADAARVPPLQRLATGLTQSLTLPAQPDDRGTR